MSVLTEWAHLRPVYGPKCYKCKTRNATEQLFNSANDPVAYFCGRCAKPALARFKAGEGI